MKNLYWRVARWTVALIGGMLMGGGLVLHAQIAIAMHMREQVDQTFFLWRGIGRMTFWMQDEVTQTAFSVSDIPLTVMVEADRAAWVMVIVGVMCALVSFFVRPGAEPATGKKKGKKKN